MDLRNPRFVSKRVVMGALCVLLVAPQLPLAQDAALAGTIGTISRVSVSSDGTEGMGGSGGPAISADGRYVVFSSEAPNLIPDDTGTRDLFLRDSTDGTLTRVDVASDGTPANGPSHVLGIIRDVCVSADGRYVAFQSAASNLVTDDTNNRMDIFVRDTVSSATTRVSVASGGTQADGHNYAPSISADGRYVAFFSNASNLAPDDAPESESDVLLHDRETGVTRRIDVAAGRADLPGQSTYPSVSSDGRYVAFLSTYDVPPDQAKYNVFVHDTATGLVSLLNVDSLKGRADDLSPPSISADGRYVAFAAAPSPPTPANVDVFIRDTIAGSTTLVSVASDGEEGTGPSGSPSISADGEHVVFVSSAGNLTPDDSVTTGIFSHDLQTGYTVLIGDAGSSMGHAAPAVSADGCRVAFESEATDLVPGDTNGVSDVFVRDRAGSSNTPPVATPCSLSTPEDTKLFADLLTSNVDSDGDLVFAHPSPVLPRDTAHGTLTLRNTGRIVYEPDADFVGVDSFDYRLWDGFDYSDWVTVTIDVTAVNDPPIADDKSYTIAEDTVLTMPAATGVLQGDADADGDPLTAVRIGGSGPSCGQLTLNSDGSFAYTPAANFVGTDSFTYRAYDGTTYSGWTTVTITVTAVNDAPVADNESYTMAEGSSLTVSAPGVLDGDTDVDGNTLQASDLYAQGPTHGNLQRFPSGAFKYTPYRDFSGTDSFTYRAFDGTDHSNWATVTISVQEIAGGLTVVPVAGPNRIDTAIQASKKAFPAGASTVVIATGYNWPDALGGAALAGALDAPILLTAPATLPDAVLAEMTRLSAKKAVILGGDSAVSAAVESALNRRLGDANVSRIAGRNRYDTASRIAAETVAEVRKSGAYDGTCFVATGANFPDALGASPLAAKKGWPIFLVNPTSGPDAALLAAMRLNGITKALVLGGTAAMPDRVKYGIGNGVPCAVERLYGFNRNDTAVVVAGYGVKNAGLNWDRLAIATGENFPDALAGGVLQARSDSVMLLTPPARMDGSVERALRANKSSINEVRFLGGTNAVSSGIRTQIQSLLR